VIVCGDADERYSMFESAKQLHWQLEDPAKLTGNETEIMLNFRAIRDEFQILVVAIAPENRMHLIFSGQISTLYLLMSVIKFC